jgi:4-amino-4-deoxy-L-arabinose transferase-like glycosyltransferase
MLMAVWQDAAGLPVHKLSDNWKVLISQREVVVDRGLVLWLRFGNILLGAATIVISFLAARVVSRDRWTPVIAAAIVAALPSFIFHAGYVNNDNLVNLLGGLLTLCALTFVRHGTVKWMVWTGVIYGLMITTKLSTLPIGFLLPILVFLAPTTRRRWVLLVYGLCSALAASSWYLIQNWVRYGDPLALRASKTYLQHVAGLGTGVDVPYVIKDPLGLVFYQVPKTLVTTFWYNSGWFNGPSWTMRTGIAIVCGLTIVLLGFIGQSLPRRPLIVLASIIVLSFVCVWVESFQTASYTSRLALVGISAMGILVALALQRWSLIVRWLVPAAELTGFYIALYHDWLRFDWARI